jgi:hypothetical protein
MQPMPTTAKMSRLLVLFHEMMLYLVFLNTCVLATEHHNQPPWLDDFQVKYINKNQLLAFFFKS